MARPRAQDKEKEGYTITGVEPGTAAATVSETAEDTAPAPATEEKDVTTAEPDPVVIVHNAQASLPLDTARRPGPEPPATAVRDYDDLVRELKDMEEMTACRGWRNFYADLQTKRDAAKECLLTAEKMNDVIRAQATVHLVDTLVKRLLEPVERINEMRSRFPLFRHEFVYTGVLDTESGRVSLVRHDVENTATNGAAPAADPPEPEAGVEAGNAVAAEAAKGEAGGAECPEPATSPESDEGTAADGAENGPADEDGEEGEEGEGDEELTGGNEPGGDDDPFGE